MEYPLFGSHLAPQIATNVCFMAITDVVVAMVTAVLYIVQDLSITPVTV